MIVRARAHPQADRLYGQILAVGPEWALIEKLDDGIYFDGWDVVRSTHITGLKPDFPDNPDYLARALAELPPPIVSKDLREAVAGTGVDALRAILASSGLVGIHIEKEDPGMLFVGRFDATLRGSIGITDVDAQGRWNETSLMTFSAKEITRVSVGGRYLDGLQRFAI